MDDHRQDLDALTFLQVESWHWVAGGGGWYGTNYAGQSWEWWYMDGQLVMTAVVLPSLQAVYYAIETTPEHLARDARALLAAHRGVVNAT
jgi:hypothetical protein